MMSGGDYFLLRHRQCLIEHAMERIVSPMLQRHVVRRCQQHALCELLIGEFAGVQGLPPPRTAFQNRFISPSLM
jgi:hypothetical protein